MKEYVYIVFLILITFILVNNGNCGECDMSAIVSFQSCVYYCVNKYGTDPTTQRKYYNRFTGNCQHAVICTNTAFRVYENRCLKDFQSFQIGTQQVSLPEIYQQIIVIMMHGNSNAIKKSQMCYPGYYSSNKKIQIGVQVYQQYFCDLLIGSDPQNYPRSHGQYFFYQLSSAEQVAIVALNCLNQPFFDLSFGILFTIQIIFLCSVIHYHISWCIKKMRRSRKRASKINEQKQDQAK